MPNREAIEAITAITSAVVVDTLTKQLINRKRATMEVTERSTSSQQGTQGEGGSGPPDHPYTSTSAVDPPAAIERRKQWASEESAVDMDYVDHSNFWVDIK